MDASVLFFWGEECLQPPVCRSLFRHSGYNKGYNKGYNNGYIAYLNPSQHHKKSKYDRLSVSYMTHVLYTLVLVEVDIIAWL